MPPSVVICSIGLVEPNPVAAAHGHASRLVISRYVSGRPPLIVEVPAPPLATTAAPSTDAGEVLACRLATKVAEQMLQCYVGVTLRHWPDHRERIWLRAAHRTLPAGLLTLATLVGSVPMPGRRGGGGAGRAVVYTGGERRRHGGQRAAGDAGAEERLVVQPRRPGRPPRRAADAPRRRLARTLAVSM